MSYRVYVVHMASMSWVFSVLMCRVSKCLKVIDLIVSISRTPTLIGLSAHKYHLEDTLNMKKDVVMRNSIKQIIAPYILSEVQYL